MDSDFWLGKRVLITGDNGFKGSWLALWLTRLGALVAGFALPPNTDPSLFKILGLANKTQHKSGDVRNLKEFQQFAAAADPQVMFHFAAQAQVRQGYARPAETFGSNVMGTVNAMEIARVLPNLRAVVVATSDKCYRNDSRTAAFRENDALGGSDPYSASKACAELVVESYRNSFFQDGRCGTATARAGNVIGGGDWAHDRIVPDCVRALAQGSRLSVRNPGATRPWQHVLDCLAGYVTLAECLWADGKKFGEAWNFGAPPERSLPVAELVKLIFAEWGRPLEWIDDQKHGPPEPQRLSLDASKAENELGWRLRLSPTETVQWTVEWYKACYDGDGVLNTSTAQIDRYEEYLGRS